MAEHCCNYSIVGITAAPESFTESPQQHGSNSATTEQCNQLLLQLLLLPPHGKETQADYEILATAAAQSQQKQQQQCTTAAEAGPHQQQRVLAQRAAVTTDHQQQQKQQLDAQPANITASAVPQQALSMSAQPVQHSCQRQQQCMDPLQRQLFQMSQQTQQRCYSNAIPVNATAGDSLPGRGNAASAVTGSLLGRSNTTPGNATAGTSVPGCGHTTPGTATGKGFLATGERCSGRKRPSRGEDAYAAELSHQWRLAQEAQQGHVVLLRGMPFKATTADVRKFLEVGGLSGEVTCVYDAAGITN